MATLMMVVCDLGWLHVLDCCLVFDWVIRLVWFQWKLACVSSVYVLDPGDKFKLPRLLLLWSRLQGRAVHQGFSNLVSVKSLLG